MRAEWRGSEPGILAQILRLCLARLFELPRLLHDYLRQRPTDLRHEIDRLVQEQRRTQRLLMMVIYVLFGFVAGLMAMQWWLRLRLW